MNITPLGIFEELRFIIELIIAELLFILPTAKRRNNFAIKISICSIILISSSFLYFPILFNLSQLGKSLNFVSNCIMLWYVFLTLFTVLLLLICFEVKLDQAFIYILAGYSIYHIEYAIVNEAIALGAYSQIRNSLFLYIPLSVFSYILLLLVTYVIFIRRFSSFKTGISMPTERKSNKIVGFILLVFLVTSTFLTQNLFRGGTKAGDFTPNYKAVFIDVMICLTVLILLYILCAENKKEKEYDVVNQLLYENGKQYALKKEMIDLVNTKCHDMKHQIEALKLLNSEDRNKELDDLEKNIMIYDSKVDTGNEVLNTLLMEKQLYCINQNIRFSFVGDGKVLEFIDTVTLFNLLGNLLDNAIEGVNKIKDDNKKSIELIISSRNDLILIQTNNYYEGEIEFENGLPKTKKEDKASHGFGIKSIKRIAKSYGGYITINTENSIFTVNVMIPKK